MFCQQSLSTLWYDFSSSRVWMWDLDYKESWAQKNLWFSTVVVEKTLKSPLDSKEIKPIKLKGNQSWILIGRIDAEAKTLILFPPEENRLIGKEPDTRKGWRQENITTENEMIAWHHRLYGHEFEKDPGVGDAQGSLPCCSPWGHKELDTTERLNWTELKEWRNMRHRRMGTSYFTLFILLQKSWIGSELNLNILSIWFIINILISFPNGTTA